MNLDHTSWRRLEAVVDAALDAGLAGEATSADRAHRVLLDLAGGDADLAEDAARLLREMAEGGQHFDDLAERLCLSSAAAELDRGAVDTTTSAEAGDPGAPQSPDRVFDRYRILDELGRGGMGVVYRAERSDEQFDKAVALKLLPEQWSNPVNAARFRAERQFLADLEHPGIARLLDGGVTEDGSPYLVMELIEGRRIDQHCEEEGLSVPERVELFLRVCEAVDAAHQKLIVHRDLKPANCMVTDDGQVKLLDFGVAQFLSEDDPRRGLGSSRLMTAAYAAPEQLRGEAVSTRTDVYSAGLLLFRLLVGRSPFADRPAALEPRRSPPLLAEALHGRSVLDTDARRVFGDLSAIVHKAMQFEADDRYPSMAALRQDLERWLAIEPVTAGSDSTWTRLERFVRRNPYSVAVSSLLGLLVLVGLSTAAFQGAVAARERDRARLEADRAERVVQLLGQVFQASSADAAESGEVSARELLARAEVRLRRQLRDDPVVLSALLQIVARSNLSLSQDDLALDLSEEAVEILQNTAVPDPLEMARARLNLANTRSSLGLLEGTEKLLTDTLADLEALSPAGAVERATGERQLARLLLRSGRAEDAIVHAESALAFFEERSDPLQAALVRTTLAAAEARLGNSERSIRFASEALALFDAAYEEDHPSIAGTRNLLANALLQTGRLEAAHEQYVRAYDSAVATFGDDNRRVAAAQTNLARSILYSGSPEDAAGHARTAQRLLASLNPDHPSVIGARINLASAQLELEERQAAEVTYREARDTLREMTGSESAASHRIDLLLGLLTAERGDPGAAPLLARAESFYRQRADGGLSLSLAEALLGQALLAATERDCGKAHDLVRASRKRIEEWPAAGSLGRRLRLLEGRCGATGAEG